jgi:hypothetical protein
MSTTGDFKSSTSVLNVLGSTINITANTTTGVGGGDVSLTSGLGTGSTTGNAGDIICTGGEGSTGDGGDIQLTCGSTLSTDGKGGSVTILGGDKNGFSNTGGQITITSGNSGVTGNGGATNLTSGNSLSTNGNGGNTRIVGGALANETVPATYILSTGTSLSTNGIGGSLVIEGGNGTGNGTGGVLEFVGGNTGNGTTGNGGELKFVGGNSVSTNGNGGEVIVNSGNGAGTGTGGDITLITGGGVASNNFQFFIGGVGVGADRYIWPVLTATAGQRMVITGVSGTNPTTLTMGFVDKPIELIPMSTTLYATSWLGRNMRFETVISSGGVGPFPIWSSVNDYIELEVGGIYAINLNFGFSFGSSTQTTIEPKLTDGTVLSSSKQLYSTNFNGAFASCNAHCFTIGATTTAKSRFNIHSPSGSLTSIVARLTITRVG